MLGGDKAGSIDASAGTIELSGNLTATTGGVALAGNVQVLSSLRIASATGTTFSGGALTVGLNILIIAGDAYFAGVVDLSIDGAVAGTGFSQINVSGTAYFSEPPNFTGALNVTLINGFSFPTGDFLPVITYTSASGTFSPTTLPSGLDTTSTPSTLFVDSGMSAATTEFWISPVSGDWSNPANWSLDRIPILTDNVYIGVSGVTVTHSTGNDTIASLTTLDPVVLTGGSLTITGGMTLDSTLDVGDGNLNAGALIFAGGRCRWCRGAARLCLATACRIS